jgi:hypothetical protein
MGSPMQMGQLIPSEGGRTPMPSPAATHSALVQCASAVPGMTGESSNRTRSPRLIAVELRYNELAKLDRTGWKVTIVDPPYA